VEEVLKKFFPCRLGAYNVELEDGDSQAFQPLEDQRDVVSADFLARYLHSWCECMCACVCMCVCVCVCVCVWWGVYLCARACVRPCVLCCLARSPGRRLSPWGVPRPPWLRHHR